MLERWRKLRRKLWRALWVAVPKMLMKLKLRRCKAWSVVMEKLLGCVLANN
jgi:hypothetical protein